MNEPNSVIAGKLQLMLLAGKDSRGRNVLDMTQIQHVAWSGNFVYPLDPSPYDIFNIVVPASQCLVIDYVSLYTSLDDLSTPQVNYGLNSDDFNTQWRIINGGSASAALTQFVESQAVVNSPIFVVYPANSTAILRIATGGGAIDIRVLLRANGWFLDSSLYTVLAKHQTIFGDG